MFNAKRGETLITLHDELTHQIVDFLDFNNQMRLALTSKFFFNQFESKKHHLIKLGCSKEALDELLGIIQKSPKISLNYNTLFCNINRMPVEPAKEVGPEYARTKLDTAVRLLCLTGQLACTTKVIDIIQNDTKTLHETISIDTQRNINYLMALNFTAYTDNLAGLQLLWEQMDETTTACLTGEEIEAPFLQWIPFINAIYSDNLGTLKWVVDTFKIAPKKVKMDKSVLALLEKLGDKSMLDYVSNHGPTIKNSF